MKNYDKSNINSFLKTLLAVVAAIHEKDLDDLHSKIKEWAKDADPFVRAYSIQRAYAKLINKFVVDEGSVTESDLKKVSADLNAKKSALEKDVVVSKDQKDMINRIRLVLKIDEKYHTDPAVTSPSYRQLLNTVYTLGEPELTKFFIPEGDFEDNRSNIKKAKALALKYMDLDTISITIAQAVEWKEKDIVSFNKFKKLRDTIKAAFKTELVQMFRKSGKVLMDFKEVCQMLDAKGVVYDLPEGFKGQINEKGKLFTTAGLELKATPYGKVIMNPNYDAENDVGYVCKTVATATQKSQTYLTMNHGKTSSKKKFENVAMIAGRVDAIKEGWRKIYNNPSLEDKAMSVLYELTYITSARIGSAIGKSINRETKKVERTYGLRTILSKHVHPDGNGVKIQYPAKAGKIQTFVIQPDGDKFATRVCAYLLKHRSEKNPDKPIFDIGGKELPYSQVNNFARKLGMPQGTGVHKFRHMEANSLAQAMFDKCPLKKGTTQKEAEDWLKVNAEKQVGDKLGHTTKNGSMALKNYIDPQLSANFFENLGLRKPKWLLELIEEDSKKDEE